MRFLRGAARGGHEEEYEAGGRPARGRFPSLIERYFLLRNEVPDQPSRFERCVEDVIRYLGSGSPNVRKAIAVIVEDSRKSSLCLLDVARGGGPTASALCSAFLA